MSLPAQAMRASQYPDYMETAHNTAVFEGMHVIRTKLIRAQMRCEDVSRSETVMGYTKSAEQYVILAVELKAARLWAEERMQELLEIN